MSDTIVRVKDLGKQFRIAGVQPRYRALRDTLADMATHARIGPRRQVMHQVIAAGFLFVILELLPGWRMVLGQPARCGGHARGRVHRHHSAIRNRERRDRDDQPAREG